MAQLVPAELQIDQFLLDPNNPRFHDTPEFMRVQENRFHEATVQDRAFKRLVETATLSPLKDSIRSNGFLPIESLIVNSYTGHDDLYVVIEGNRRIGALRWLKEEHEAGVSVPDGVIEQLQHIPVLIAKDADSDPVFLDSLLGVRHVSGIKEWGGYQRARLVRTLRDEHNLESNEVAARLGMSITEVNRRYRAFRVLDQMNGDEEYGSYAHPDLYPLFHEAVSVPDVRNWLGWDETLQVFTHDEELERFYELISPSESEDGESKPPKVTTYSQVRELRSILANVESKRVLLDPDKSYSDAVAIAKREDVSKSWVSRVASAIDALATMSFVDLQRLSEEDVAEIEKLKDLSEQLLAGKRKLIS